ncbi:hypothetical protein NERG_00390 [Nematocida ausubeli]|uniref:Uncharacterized protein n=1 Tax=Nematocida ausubeli (strain ATCC PRA-371 / ERTm2) TaxID=1913371 RepID=H8Z9W9_NEMA1|nr:hypothetical protein NERG_00390 [Nematocida ausubeli]
MLCLILYSHFQKFLMYYSLINEEEVIDSSINVSLPNAPTESGVETRPNNMPANSTEEISILHDNSVEEANSTGIITILHDNSVKPTKEKHSFIGKVITMIYADFLIPFTLFLSLVHYIMFFMIILRAEFKNSHEYIMYESLKKWLEEYDKITYVIILIIINYLLSIMYHLLLEKDFFYTQGFTRSKFVIIVYYGVLTLAAIAIGLVWGIYSSFKLYLLSTAILSLTKLFIALFTALFLIFGSLQNELKKKYDTSSIKKSKLVLLATMIFGFFFISYGADLFFLISALEYVELN